MNVHMYVHINWAKNSHTIDFAIFFSSSAVDLLHTGLSCLSLRGYRRVDLTSDQRGY